MEDLDLSDAFRPRIDHAIADCRVLCPERNQAPTQRRQFAALFAVHPMHVESVAWVSERKDLLCGLFGLLSILMYVGYARRGGVLRYTACLLLFVASLLAKPMLVTVPFLLLLLAERGLAAAEVALLWGVHNGVKMVAAAVGGSNGDDVVAVAVMGRVNGCFSLSRVCRAGGQLAGRGSTNTLLGKPGCSQ